MQKWLGSLLFVAALTGGWHDARAESNVEAITGLTAMNSTVAMVETDALRNWPYHDAHKAPQITVAPFGVMAAQLDGRGVGLVTAGFYGGGLGLDVVRATGVNTPFDWMYPDPLDVQQVTTEPVDMMAAWLDRRGNGL